MRAWQREMDRETREKKGRESQGERDGRRRKKGKEKEREIGK